MIKPIERKISRFEACFARAALQVRLCMLDDALGRKRTVIAMQGTQMSALWQDDRCERGASEIGWMNDQRSAVLLQLRSLERVHGFRPSVPPSKSASKKKWAEEVHV